MAEVTLTGIEKRHVRRQGKAKLGEKAAFVIGIRVFSLKRG
jgi:hypothetical protein